MQNPIGNEASIADREELRAKVWPDIEEDVNRVAYDVRYLRMFGTDAGILLSRLVYWTCKGDDPDGWIHKTREEVFEEFGLDGRRALYAARDRLQAAGVLETTKRPRMGWREGEYRVVKPSPTTHYRVDLAILAELLDRFEDDPDGTTESLKRHFKQSKTATRSHTRSHNSGDKPESERYEPYRLNEPDRTAPYTRVTSEGTSGSTYRDSALQAGKKQFSDENSKEAHASLVLAAKEKEEKQEPYNTLGSTPYPFGDDDAWDRATTEGDEEPADPRSNGWNEDEDQAAVEKHNTWRSADTILDDIRELDRADAVIESEEEVFEMARSVFGHAHEGGMDEAS